MRAASAAHLSRFCILGRRGRVAKIAWRNNVVNVASAKRVQFVAVVRHQ
jgi:hypothetical protein